MKRHDGHGSGYNVGSHRDPSRAWAGTGAAAGTSEFAGMSAFGTKRTSELSQPMSAFGGKADIKHYHVTAQSQARMPLY